MSVMGAGRISRNGSDNLDGKSANEQLRTAAQRVGGLLRAAWLRPKQTDLVPDKGQFRSRFPHPLRIVVRQRFFGIPATDTDIISAQHFWTGGLETAGPGCYDAVAIARAAGFRLLVMTPASASYGDCVNRR